MPISLLAALLLQPAEPPALPDWEAQGRTAVQERLATQVIDAPARNVILFIADGMDITTVTAARIRAGQKAGGTGEEHVLAFESLPFTALSKTYNTDAQTPDSAGTATAMLSGRKTRAGVINVDQRVPRGDCDAALLAPLPTLADLAARTDRSTGVVTTAKITHATPAAVYASSADRDWEADADLPQGAGCPDIAAQLLSRAEGLNMTVALGGGRANFLPLEAGGRRKDGRDLAAAWQAAGGALVTDGAALAALSSTAPEPVLGLFANSHMAYEADRTRLETGEPSLAEMTRFAIEKLDGDEDGYVLMVEGARIDHAHHGGNAARALDDTIAFDEAVATALAMTDPEETLIIVTADHGHTIAMQGYQTRGTPILGLVARDGEPVLAGDGKPYTTLAYANGPGAAAVHAHEDGRPGVTEEEAMSLEYKQQALVPGYSESHGGQDVAVWARGPQAHLVRGTMEQNVLYFIAEHALTAGGEE